MRTPKAVPPAQTPQEKPNRQAKKRAEASAPLPEAPGHIDMVLLRRLQCLESERHLNGRWAALCSIAEKWTSHIQGNEAWLRGQLQQLATVPAPPAPAPHARLAFHFHNDEGPGVVVVAAGGAEHWRAQFGEGGKTGRATITDIHGRVVHVNIEYVTYVEIEPAEAAR